MSILIPLQRLIFHFIPLIGVLKLNKESLRTFLIQIILFSYQHNYLSFFHLCYVPFHWHNYYCSIVENTFSCGHFHIFTVWRDYFAPTWTDLPRVEPAPAAEAGWPRRSLEEPRWPRWGWLRIRNLDSAQSQCSSPSSPPSLLLWPSPGAHLGK